MRLIFAMPGNEAFAARLATAAGAESGGLEIGVYPDEECHVRLASDPAGRHVDIVCTLARSNPQILPLIFAADAARDLGAASVGLVAPYLGYMRQDARFRPGEAITSRSFARLISGAFDSLVTVDPHLHRYANLSDIYPIRTRALTAAPQIARWIASHVARPLVVGPDAESDRWTGRVAALTGAPHIVMTKERLGDREVRVHAPDLTPFRGLTPVLVDDVAASGRTLVEASRRLALAGLEKPVCIVTHAIFGGDAAERLAEASACVVSTDTIAHGTNAISIAPLIAEALGA